MSKKNGLAVASNKQQPGQQCSTCKHWEPTCKKQYSTAATYWCKDFAALPAPEVAPAIEAGLLQEESGPKFINGFPDPETPCPTDAEFATQLNQFRKLKAQRNAAIKGIKDLYWYIYSYACHKGDNGQLVTADGCKVQIRKKETPKWNEAEALKFCEEQKKTIDAKKNKEAAELFAKSIKMVPALDWDVWELLKRGDHVPEDVQKKVEWLQASFALFTYDLSKKECPNCSVTVMKTDKFCRACGTNLPEAFAKMLEKGIEPKAAEISDDSDDEEEKPKRKKAS